MVRWFFYLDAEEYQTGNEIDVHSGVVLTSAKQSLDGPIVLGQRK